jgi:hypothetical protein
LFLPAEQSGCAAAAANWSTFYVLEAGKVYKLLMSFLACVLWDWEQQQQGKRGEGKYSAGS